MSGEGFLSRWSRRKRAAGSGLAAPEPPAQPPLAAEAPPPAPAEPEFDPASLPPVESLTIESDFAAFLRKEVPEALRRAALRKAWALDPAIRDFVGPADYAWDFNAPDGVPGFGFDLGGDVRRLLAQAIGLDGEAGGEPARETPTRAVAEGEAAPTPPPPAEPAPAVIAADSGPMPAAEAPPAARRRHGSALPA